MQLDDLNNSFDNDSGQSQGEAKERKREAISVPPPLSQSSAQNHTNMNPLTF